VTWAKSQTWTFRLGVFDGVAGSPSKPRAFIAEASLSLLPNLMLWLRGGVGNAQAQPISAYVGGGVVSATPQASLMLATASEPSRWRLQCYGGSWWRWTTKY
jgi:hypothetical protein